MLAGNSTAHAAFILFTDATFFTPTSDGTLTFTFEGHSADFFDTMNFAINGSTIFNNQAALGTQVFKSVTAGTTYRLTLITPAGVPDWSSNPALNSDGLQHLAATAVFADFNLGAAPAPKSTDCAFAVGACYLGWEDLPPQSDADYNDLVFAMQFTPVPEPTTLAIVGSGLLGFGAIQRFRNRAKRRRTKRMPQKDAM